MGLAKAKTYWTVEDYLAFEKNSPVRHEYISGQLYAMAGGSKNHNRLADDFGAVLNRQFAQRGQPCEAFTSDVKVHVNPEVYYYPDVVVACEELAEDETEDEYIAENPVLLVEVLSKRTQRTDRFEKMREYQFLSSLREYVLIEQTHYQVEVYRHAAAGEPWQREIYTAPEQEVVLASVNARCTLAEIYARVRFGANLDDGERESE
ncbi:MAG TPA: Uma2 family endonuclease [Blastocatellia bacterium]|nr:Uma2 family endonuclease [Blastocatellia bacterium]